MADAAQWWNSTVIYQAYPRSFADSNGDGIGDLQGIIDRLDHLVDLGVETLWVSPFFASPQRDIGYDVSSYRDVAPEYGTMDDAQKLIDEAHARGLRVLFDLVLNHTSDEHAWFEESRQDRTNPKADWYVWADGARGRNNKPKPPNNWRSELQLPRAWQWGEERQQWYLATFLGFQPDLNWRNPEVRAEMFDMVRMWLGRGVDGFRLDIFGSIMQDAHLRDNDRRPALVADIPRVQTPTRTLNTDENFTFAGDLRAVADEFEGDDRILVGEVFGSAPVLRRYLNDNGRDGLHLVFLFEFLSARYGAGRYRKLIDQFETDFPAPLIPTYVVENHDRARSLSRLGGDLRKARVLATLLCTLRGVPVIYQGQEVGMENRYIPLADAIDPMPRVVARRLPEWLNRRLPERLNRDEVRTPMQWEPGPNAGFCDPDVEPWLAVHDNHTVRNVATQTTDPDSLFNWYRALLTLRRERPALHAGTLSLDPQRMTDVVAYERQFEDDHVWVVANLGDQATTMTDHRADAGELVLTSSEGITLGRGCITLPAHTAAVLDLTGSGTD